MLSDRAAAGWIGLCVLLTPLIAGLVITLAPRLAKPEPVRSVYDVGWEDVSWCVYSRLDPGYTPPEMLARIIRFCVVVGE